MQSLLKAFLRYLAEVAASEAGELLSVRRKAHLLEAERYSRLASEPKPGSAAIQAATAARCAGSTHAARALKTRSAH
ncbi:MAG: hypothetical protein Q8L44_04405 [Sulfuritalea sp.]|nr:hypothetical protein [Sulfuritalea sp.]